MRRLASRTSLVALLLAGTAGPATPAGRTDIARVDDVIDAPLVMFGRDETALRRALGAPSDVALATLASDRDPSATRPVRRLAWPGLIIDVSGSPVRVDLTDPGPRLPWGLGVGVRTALVEETLGEPLEATDTRLGYIYSDGFPRTVTFHHEAGVVRRIVWRYWIE